MKLLGCYVILSMVILFETYSILRYQFKIQNLFVIIYIENFFDAKQILYFPCQILE